MEDKIIALLIENTWMFSILFMAVWLMKKIFQKQLSEMIHYVLWGVVVLKLIVPVSFASAFSPWNYVAAPAVSVQAAQSAFVEATDEISQLIRELQLSHPSGQAGNVAKFSADQNKVALPVSPAPTIAADAAEIQIDWIRVCLILWLCGISAMSLWLCSSANRVRRRITQESRAVPESIQTLFLKL